MMEFPLTIRILSKSHTRGRLACPLNWTLIFSSQVCTGGRSARTMSIGHRTNPIIAKLPERLSLLNKPVIAVHADLAYYGPAIDGEHAQRHHPAGAPLRPIR